MDDGYVIARRLRGTQPAAPDTRPGAEWMTTAPCRNAPDLFYHDDAIGYEAIKASRLAKAICRACPHRAPCLALAMTAERRTDDRFGVFAGLTGDERARLARTGWKPGDPLPAVRIEGKEKA